MRYTPDEPRRPIGMNKYLRRGRIGFHRIYTRHWSGIIDWFTMISPLLLSNMFACLSCTKINSSRSLRRFGRIIAVPPVRWYPMPTGSPNHPSFYRWKNLSQLQPPVRTPSICHRLLTTPSFSTSRIPGVPPTTSGCRPGPPPLRQASPETA
jgi:hypothetical protein